MEMGRVDKICDVCNKPGAATFLRDRHDFRTVYYHEKCDPDPPEVCRWTPVDELDTWRAGCDGLEMVTFQPTSEDWRFCPYCGKRIEEAK